MELQVGDKIKMTYTGNIIVVHCKEFVDYCLAYIKVYPDLFTKVTPKVENTVRSHGSRLNFIYNVRPQAKSSGLYNHIIRH